MTRARPGIRFAFLAFTFLIASTIHAQVDPTALRRADLSAFGGVTGIYTGLSNGRNAAVTAGLDFNLPEIFRVRPALEVRATDPFDRGSVDRQKSILGGFRLETRYDRLHPYVDLLGGRGQVTFNGPYTTFAGTFILSQPPSNVLSPGLGFRFDLGGQLSFLADAQFQRWSTPASLSGHLFAKPLTVGLSYRFAYSRRHPASPR
jgi:hypothetical protein